MIYSIKYINKNKSLGYFHNTLRISLVFLLLLGSNLFAQNEASNWHIQDLNFHFNKDGSITTTDDEFSGVNKPNEVISDSSGKILFYTNGYYVWNKNHNLMPHGYISRSGQSPGDALIIPYPSHSGMFYVISSTSETAATASYSLVDMNRDKGLGEVVDSNHIFLGMAANSYLRVTAVRHYNKHDFWIIISSAHYYYSYLLSSDGISKKPVITNIGWIPLNKGSWFQYWGIKFSSDGKLLADYYYSDPSNTAIFIFNFNNQYGNFTGRNYIKHISDNDPKVRNFEFSPDNTKLYVTSRNSHTDSSKEEDNNNSIFQYDLSKNTDTAIENSRTLIYKDLLNRNFGSLQIANNCKIYIARELSDSLAVINYPNKKGKACNFELNELSLLGRQGSRYIPQFLPNFFRANAYFTWDTLCSSDSIPFHAEDNWNDGSAWDFGDSASRSANISFSPNPKHLFSAPGTYLVSHVVTKCDTKDSFSVWVTIAQPVVNLGNDTGICEGKLLCISSGFPAWHNLWSTGDTNGSICVNKTGDYSVKKFYGQCAAFGKIHLEVHLKALPPPDHYYEICDADSIKMALDGGDNAFWDWENSLNHNRYDTVNRPGVYHLNTSTSFGCILTDSISVVNKCESSLYFPDAFTPEETTGLNNIYIPIGRFISDYYIQIINRLGVVVFESRDLHKGWDGTLRGFTLPEGVYFYYTRYSYTNTNGKIQNVKKTGNISLLR